MDSGVGIRYIQELPGHKDIKTTLIDTHVNFYNQPFDHLQFNEEKIWNAEVLYEFVADISKFYSIKNKKR